jgi:hypothetical protein
MIEIDGRLLGPMVDTRLMAGSTVNGIKITETLERECNPDPTARLFATHRP